jgi:Xaa-Pro aminopeptidase
MRLIGRKKIDEIRDRLTEKGLDAALFVNSEPVIDSNISYLSGFSGMLNGALILGAEDMRLVTTELDYDRAQTQAYVDEILRCGDSMHLYQSLKRQCGKYRKIGVVKNKFTVEMAERSGIRTNGLVDVSPVLERARMVKEPGEIEVIRKCADISNGGVQFLQGFLREGIRENEVAAELERNLKIRGSEYPPFETIVTSGGRSTFVHPSPPASDKSIGPGLGIVDFGAVFRGYSTDVTVPFAAGKPSERQRQMIDAVMSAWEAVIKRLKAGIKTKTLHDIYEKAIEDAGFGVKHSLGHSVGLDVHEYPSVSGTDTELKDGMVLAIEPGAYDRKSGGCRLENTIVVKKNGCELLTKSKLIRM